MESVEVNSNLKEISLQKAGEGDIPLLVEQERSVSGTPTYSPTLDEDEWKQTLRNEEVWLIKQGNEIVGNISYEQRSPEHIHISGLMVIPAYQGKGVGRTVLERFLEEHSHVERIDLVTHPDNPALKLYESLGFVVEFRKENWFGDGEPRLRLVLKR